MLDKSDRLEYYKLFFLQNGYENDIAQTNFPWGSGLEYQASVRGLQNGGFVSQQDKGCWC